MSSVIDGTVELNTALGSDIIPELQLFTKNWSTTLSQYRTGKLWLMYMHLVSILRAFLRSSRTGSWNLYLQSLREMLPFLAASGHNNYVKSLVLYLNKMDALEQTHPEIHAKFMDGLFVLRRSDSFWAGMFTDLYIESVLMASVKSVGGLTRGRGFEESTRLVWLLSMPACAEVHKALQDVTELSGVSASAKHKDLTQSRLKRDAKDLQSILDYLEERQPFSMASTQLRSLESGVIADGSVNVDNAEQIGMNIIASMDGLSVSQFRFLKKNQVINLASAMYVTIDGEKIDIDPLQLYQRLLVAGMGTIEIHELFMYELCSYPSSLFDKQVFMRTPDKAELQNGLCKKVPDCIVNEVPVGVAYVLDGGALLHRLPWPKGHTYLSLCHQYTQYIQRHFEEAVVVFDGYDHGPSTKDETHCRRSGKEVGVEVSFEPNMFTTMKKAAFLANQRNKQGFLYLLGSELVKASIKVKHCKGDADYDIAITACTLARTKPVVVVGDDTDLLVLLQHHYNPAEHETMFLRTHTKTIDVTILQGSLDQDLRNSLLFIHALSGCDMTSRPYGIGKISAMNKFADLQMPAKLFLTPDVTHLDIEKAGEQALISIYGGISGSDLNFTRASKFTEKVVASSSYIPPERLPPTSDAARFHSQRVYLQVQAWLGISLNPTEWGWSLHKSDRLRPRRMEKSAAPASLLKIIRCNCTGKCDKNTCSCRKNGLLCTMACGQCKGITCRNGQCHDLPQSVEWLVNIE